jgi:acetolactate synthase-1/2/3 large subunit
MVVVNGAQLIVRTLKNEKVKVIFTLCGDDDLIYNYCEDAGIRLIDFRHEQATGHAAQGWSIATGEVGVCLVQSGPGVTDLAPSITVAYQECIPVVALATHPPLMTVEKCTVNEFDAAKMYNSFTKWSGFCYETARLPEYINMCFRIAAGGRPGPVLLNIPVDVMVKECDDGLECVESCFHPMEKNRTLIRPYGDPDAIKRALKLLLNAKRPVVMLGSGAGFANAGEEARKFVELTKIPVGAWGWGQGLIPDDHPLCFGLASIMEGPGQVMLPVADMALVVGLRYTDLFGYGQPPFFAPDVKIIQVDIHAEEIGRNRPAEIGIVGDAKAVLSQFYQQAKETLKEPRPETDWVKNMRVEKQKFEDRLAQDGSSNDIPIKPQRLAKEIREFMPKDGIIILDGGDTTVWGLMYLRAYYPKHLYFSGGLYIQHLGGGVPMAIAAKAANPEKKVLVYTGDGSFLFNGKEIDTARRHDLPFVTVIHNDCQWGMVARIQRLSHGPKFYGLASKLSSNTRYDKYAEAFDCYGELVTDPKEIKPALKRAFDSGVPAVVDVRINPDVETILDYLWASMYNPASYERKVPEKAPEMVAPTQ